jgi:hypothetical protein
MLQKVLAAIVVEEWAKHYEADLSISKRQPLMEASNLAREMSNRTLAWLQAEPPTAYHEMAFALARIHGECTHLLQSFSFDCKVPWTEIPTLGTEIDLTGSKQGAFSLASAEAAVEQDYLKLKERVGKAKKRELAVISEKRKTVLSSIERYKEIKTQHDIRVCAAFAAAFVALKSTPDKVSPIVKGVMNGIKVYPILRFIGVKGLTFCRTRRTWISKHAQLLPFLPSLISVRFMALPNPQIRLSRISAPFCAKMLSRRQPLLTTENISLVSCPSEAHRKWQRMVYRKRTKQRAEKGRACRGVVLDWLLSSFPLNLRRSFWRPFQKCGNRWLGAFSALVQ